MLSNVDSKHEEPVGTGAFDTGTAAANTAVTITLLAPTGDFCHVLGGIIWSYSAAPTAGGITITDGGVTVVQVDITAGGPGFLPFTPSKRFGASGQVIVTLAAAGAGVVGKLNLNGHSVERDPSLRQH